MRLEDRMTEHPPRCLHCGQGNAEEELQIPVLNLERDVNWGDSTYICGRCVMKAAALYEYISPDQYRDLERTIESLKEERHELKAKLDVKERRIQQIIEGKKALKDEKEERSAA